MQDGKHVILCVDDDADILDAARTILEAEGFAFVGAPSAEEGLRVYDQSGPDLIIADLMMEEVDSGTGFVKELKLKGNTAPVFMLSSVGDSLSETTDTAELGLAGVLQKPLDPGKLLSVIRSKLG
jgi:DNA-binding response OmpR family regulator